MTTENSSIIKSPYIQMAMQAMARRWCWNIYCPFCGHLPYRYALLELADGVMPGADDWQMHKWPHSREHYLKKWGRQGGQQLPSQWDMNREVRLARMLEAMDISELIEHVPFPEFVYILGIGLYYTERVERHSGKITRSLIRQLQSEINLTQSDQADLREKIDGDRRLTWQDMPLLERIIRTAIGAPARRLKGVFKFTIKTTVPGFLERLGRRRIIAGMLNRYEQQSVLKPHIIAYVLTASEIVLLANVENSYSFSNGLVSHLASAMLVRKEAAAEMDYIRRNGVFDRNISIVTVDDPDRIPYYISQIEKIPVEKEYIANAREWLWSSACTNPLVDINFGHTRL